MFTPSSSRLWTLILLLAGTGAHPDPPSTPEQAKVYADLQAASYLCAPAVAQFTAERQRVFAQKILAGTTGVSSLGASELFDESDLESDSLQKLLSCRSADDSKIRNNTCILAPMTTMGPYYQQKTHPIRNNIAEYEPGLLSLYNIGVIDVNTCEPVPNVLVDIWQANATGYYSQFSGAEPVRIINTEDTRNKPLAVYPPTNDETFLRGAWPTDKNGVASFTSIFPGYYTARATHVHVQVHPEWIPHANGTFTSKRVTHIGQFFFDDSLNAAVDKLYPYSTNQDTETYGRTRNWDDSFDIYSDSFAGGYNPIMDTFLIGGVLEQGLVSYITLTVNMSVSVTDFNQGVVLD